MSWKSRKQQCVSLSSCEADSVVLTGAIHEAKFLRQLFIDIYHGNNENSVLLNVDNQGALALAKNPVYHKRSKLIDIIYHYIRSEVQNGIIQLKYVPTEDNMADIFTKPVTRTKFNKFMNFNCSLNLSGILLYD